MEVYQSCNSLEKRLNESNRILQKHPERVPIIVCKSAGCKWPEIDKQKFLVPKEMTLGQFIYVVRKRIKLDANEALFVLVNKNLQPSSKIISEIYENNKSEDNFLYIEYSSENTFG